MFNTNWAPPKFSKLSHLQHQERWTFCSMASGLYLNYLIFILSQYLLFNGVSNTLRSQESRAVAKKNFGLKLHVGGGPLKTNYAPRLHHFCFCFNIPDMLLLSLLFHLTHPSRLCVLINLASLFRYLEDLLSKVRITQQRPLPLKLPHAG